MSYFLHTAIASTTSQLQNPFTVTSVEGILIELINVLLIFAVPIIMFFLIYAGFQYVTARGNPEQIKTASRALLYGLIGAVIVFGAWAIAAIIQSTVNAF